MRDNGGVSDSQQPEPRDLDEQAHVEASAAVEPETTTEVSQDEVVVRRSPRYGRFMLIGAILGAVVAFVLSFAFAPTDAQIAERLADDFTYDQGQVFGFLLLGGVAIGGALGALVALVLDRVLARKAAHVVAEHDETHRVGD